VAERVLRVGPIGAEPLPAQHEDHPVAEGEEEREVELEVRLLRGGAPDRARVEDTHAVELAALEEELVEAAHLVRRRHQVGRGHDGREEAGLVRHRDRPAELDAEGAAEDRGERRQGRGPGEVVDGHLAAGGGLGRPARWISTCRMVIHCLGRTANSGMYSHTGSSRRITSPWSRRWITIAVTALAAEKMLNGVAGVARTFGASGGSSGPLPRAWPMARSIRTCPCRRTQSWIAGWRPLA